MSFWIISWLTLPAVLKKNERVHRDGSLHRCGNSSRTSCELRPLMSRGMSEGRAAYTGQRIGVGANEEVDMIGLNSQPKDLPFMLICYHLADDLFQTVSHRPNKHLAAPLRTPDDVIHDKVYTMLLVLVLHVAIGSFFNNACKSERPFIPRLKTGGFLAHFL